MFLVRKKRRLTFLQGLVCLCALTCVNLFAQDTVTYRARISASDKRNSSGQQLLKVEQIIRQDRANFHRNLNRDAGDQHDPLFSDAKNREMLERLVLASNLASAVVQEIVSGNPLIEVNLTGAGGRSPRLSVSIIQEMPSGVSISESSSPNLEALYRRWILNAEGKREATGELLTAESNTTTSVRPMKRSPGVVYVRSKKGLWARAGALTQDGRHALLETAPGIVELWDVQSNLQVFSYRVLEGSILLITRAAEDGWMLCVAKSANFAIAIYRVPTRPGIQPELLWSCSQDFELSNPETLLFISDVIPGDSNGALYLTAKSWKSRSSVIRLLPESHRFESIAQEGDFDRWIEDTLKTPEGRIRLRASAISSAAPFVFPATPMPGEFSQLREWMWANHPTSEVARYLDVVKNAPQVLRRLDQVGARTLLQRPAEDVSDVETHFSKSWVGFPVYVHEEGGRTPRRLGHRSPVVTVQDFSEDGDHLLVRLAVPESDLPHLIDGIDPWIDGYLQPYRSFSILLVDLRTLQAKPLASSESELVAAFDSDGAVALGEIRLGERICFLRVTDLEGGILREARVPLGHFTPKRNTTALQPLQPGHWHLSFSDRAKCSDKSVRPFGDFCDWHQGHNGGRYSFYFTLSKTGAARIGSSSCLDAARASTGNTAQLSNSNRVGTLRFVSPTGNGKLLSLPARWETGDETPSWFTSDGDRILAAYNPSGSLFFLSQDDPYRDRSNTFEIIDIEQSQRLLDIQNIRKRSTYTHGRIEGGAFCWTGDRSVFFATESSVVSLHPDENPPLRANPRPQAGIPNRAVHDRTRNWVALSRDNAVDFFSVEGGRRDHVASIFFDTEGRPFAFDSQSHFSGNTRAGAAASLEIDGEAYHFTQFDGLLNRPDVLLETFGADPALVTSAREYRKRRNEKLGYSGEQGPVATGLPEIRVVGTPPLSVNSATVSLALEAADPLSSLDRIQVYSNGVPVFGKEGLSLDPSTGAKWSGTVDVPLLRGQNDLRISATNRSGLSSHETTLSISSETVDESVLYLAALGVSRYQDTSQNLELAAKDALDLTAHFKANPGGLWTRVETMCLTDFDVTSDSLHRVRKFLARARPKDGAILFLGGHGLLDSNLEFRFATSEVDFATEKAGEGIRFSDLEDALFDCVSLRKLLLMDTCHGGEIDESRLQLLTSARAGEWLALKDAPRLDLPTPDFDELVAGRNLIEHFFADLRRGSGATVLASSAGLEQSFEAGDRDIKNGIFTHCVLKCLREKAGDLNRDGMIDLTELRGYVESEVARITNGHQKPSTRSFNLVNPFVIAR